MTTTELIEILRKNEFGGATGRPREVSFCAGDWIISTDGIEVTGSGDGLITELDLSLPDAERKTGKWVDDTYCSECGWVHTTEPGFIGSVEGFNFCPSCGADMRGGDSR